MKLTDREKGVLHRMREVSDLRTQYQCEYRLHLKQKSNDTHSLASKTAIELHSHVSRRPEHQQAKNRADGFIPLIIIVITLIAGFLWILG